MQMENVFNIKYIIERLDRVELPKEKFKKT